MSLSAKYPRYSFVQGGDLSSDCCPDPTTCLPISDPAHLIFQVTLCDIDAGFPGAGRPNSSLSLVAVPPDDSCTYLGWDPGSPVQHPPLYDFLPIMRPLGNVVYYHQDGINYADVVFGAPVNSFDALTAANNPLLGAMPVGTCFKFKIVWDLYSLAEPSSLLKRFYFGCTNCFVRVAAEDCYRSIVEYRNPSDSFDFKYEGGNPYAPITNRIELPVYLRDPLMQNDQKVYTKSDGGLVKLYERKEEVYTLETELMPYAWHKALDVALSHDDIQINNKNAAVLDPYNTATRFVKKDNYEIEYMKAPLSGFGKGQCKLSNADAVHLVNNNCG